ncbi:MAG: hypothetical protein K2Y05_06940, partial [Hyphomicrobiaceae bacterium]|nr:hypothetical protein [Hyphomicrobiaceae bacterium]
MKHMPDAPAHQTATPDPRAVTAPLNVACACVTLDRRRLGDALTAAFGDAAFAAGLADSHPHLISAQPVFVSSAEITAIAHAVSAIEAACVLPSVVDAVAARAPDIASTKPGPIGLFMGYDFHLTAEGPKLIEINTNAGGGLLNAYLREAHRTCCQLLGTSELPSTLDAVLDAFTAAFDTEWRLHCLNGGKTGTQLGSVAIIDRDPAAQYLYPEFRLFERLLRSR